MGNTSKDFIASGEQHAKLREGSTDDSTPRETPAQQGPGGRGYSRPELEAWTEDELRTHANALGIDKADGLTRRELVATILHHFSYAEGS